MIHLQKHPIGKTNDEHVLPMLNEIDSDQTNVFVPTNIFTNDDDMLFKVNLSKDVFIVGYESSIRQDILLQYSSSSRTTLSTKNNEEPIAVCKLMLGGLVTYKIYTTKPNYPGQKKSRRTHKNNNNIAMNLYTYGEIKRTNKKNQRKLLLVSPPSSASSIIKERRNVYTIETYGVSCRNVMKEDGSVVSLARCRNVEDMSTHLLLAPGTDPYLMVCVEAMCERLDTLERDI